MIVSLLTATTPPINQVAQQLRQRIQKPVQKDGTGFLYFCMLKEQDEPPTGQGHHVQAELASGQDGGPGEEFIEVA